MAAKLSLSELHNLEHSPVILNQPTKPSQLLDVIFRVNKANYVPPGVAVRARIDAMVFTGTILAKDLEVIASDPNVRSIGPPKPMQIIE